MSQLSSLLLAVICLICTDPGASAQSNREKNSPKQALTLVASGQEGEKKQPRVKPNDHNEQIKGEDPLALQRTTIAISLLTSIADEAKSYHDQTLRSRVQARAADALWNSDNEKARTLFRRAWESAFAADKEAFARYMEQRRNQSSTSGAFVQAPPNLTGEVLRLLAKRDSAMADEFLSELKEASDTKSPTSGGGSLPSTPDPENPSPEVAQRLSLARQFLEAGEIGLALHLAEKALDNVTTRGIFFLCALREKDEAAADQRFAGLLARTVADPFSDAVGVSVLSSYVFTPFLYIIVRGNGASHSSRERELTVAPNIPPDLRLAFLSGAAQILLRPLLPADQDPTIAGRRGLYFTIARLLPLYEQFAADLAPPLRVQLAALAADVPEDLRTDRNAMLTRGLVPEDQMRDEGREALDQAERVANPADRDQLYVRGALAAAYKGDVGARDLLDKVGDSDLRKRARAQVDFALVSRALDKKDAQEVQRLLHAAELTHIQRVWALLGVAQMLKEVDQTRAIEVLDEAGTVARRIGGNDPDRARGLVGVATLMFDLDRGRVWEALNDAIKAANSTSQFRGEDAQVVSRFSTVRGTTISNHSVESFNLLRIFGLLAKEDLYRSIELARNFASEAPRATATLAIARAVLESKSEAAPGKRDIVISN